MTTTPLSATATVGANMRAELGRRGCSQTQLAEALGLSQTAVSKRLRGVVPFDIQELTVAAAWLDVPLGVLLHGVAAA